MMQGYCYSSEELKSLDSESLQNLFFKTRSEIFCKKRKQEDSRELEIYYCYIMKEIQNRANYV